MTVLHKLYWVLNNLATVFAPAITIGYWTLVYDPELHAVDCLNVSEHIINSIVAVVDLFMCSHPVHLLHAYQHVILAFSYGAFSVIYFLVGGTARGNDINIYPLLDWNHPTQTMLAVLGFTVLLILLHIITWCLYLLRRYLAQYVASKSSPNSESELVISAISINE